MQGEDFSNQISSINKGRSLSSFDTNSVFFILVCKSGTPIRLMMSNITVLIIIINQYHPTHLLAGPTTLINNMHQKLWILAVREAIHRMVFKCHRCPESVLETKPLEPFIDNLPSSRVQLINPSTHSCRGRFCGPFCNRDTQSVPLCLRIPWYVKAVHFEVTSDLITEAFLASFYRFVAKRGMPSAVYSNCGQNFLGTANYFKEQ